MTFVDSGAMDETKARTQGAPIAALSGRLRTPHWAVQRGRATQPSFCESFLLREGRKLRGEALPAGQRPVERDLLCRSKSDRHNRHPWEDAAQPHETHRRGEAREREPP